jgi:hypothetical protein
MPEKSASIAQQRLMGMAWAARTGRLDTSKIEDEDWREKVDKIAKSKNFSDDTLHKMASTKYKDEKTGKMRPYLIGKGTPEEPEKKRRPYKKSASEGYIQTFSEFLNERIKEEYVNFYEGVCEAYAIMGESTIPSIEDVSEMIIANMLTFNRPMGQNYSGVTPIKNWKNVTQHDTIDPEVEREIEDEESLTNQQVMKSRTLFKGGVFGPTFEEFMEMRENVQLNPGMSLTGMGPVSLPGNPGTNSSFHTQEPGSGDFPSVSKRKKDEDEEEEAERIKKELSRKKDETNNS